MDQDGNYTREDLVAKTRIGTIPSIPNTQKTTPATGRLAMLSGCEPRKKRFGFANHQILTQKALGVGFRAERLLKV